jgi:hypothetical protein
MSDIEPTPLPPKQPGNHTKAEKIRRKINAIARRKSVRGDTTPELQRGEKGAIIGNLNKFCGDDYVRKRVLAYLFLKGEDYFLDASGDKIKTLSTKKLTSGQWYAMKQWQGAWLDEDDGWKLDPVFEQECIYLAKVVQREDGQLDMFIDASAEEVDYR